MAKKDLPVEEPKKERIVPVDIWSEMKESYLAYAM